MYCYTFSLDLHVLGAPPAFVLSQDQTLKKGSIGIGPEGHLFNTPYLAHYSLYSVVKEQPRSSREPCNLLLAGSPVKGLQNKILIGYFLRIRCDVSYYRHRPLGRIKSVLQVNNTSPKSQDLLQSRKPSHRPYSQNRTKSMMSRLRVSRRMSQE